MGSVLPVTDHHAPLSPTTSRFVDLDCTRDGAGVVHAAGLSVPPADPLPHLVEFDDFPRVGRPSDDPLIQLEHPRIALIERYRQAGWEHAIEGIWLRRPVAERLGLVADRLPERWGLCVFDGWRPNELQQELYDAAYADPLLPPGYLAPPSDDPQAPPPHLSGGSVDVSLTLDGIPLGLGTRFDDFTELARTDALEVPASGALEVAASGTTVDLAMSETDETNRNLRRWLYWSMRAAGFVVFAGEWWHFEYGTRRWAAITGHEPFYGAARPQ